MYNLQQIQEVLNKKKYLFFTGEYSLNIIGIRSKSSISDKFDDFLYLVYNNGKETVVKCYNITTDPGKNYLLTPMDKRGCAIMVPGQYRSAYTLGQHKGYDALVQHLPISFVRDNDKNNILNFDLYKIPSNIRQELIGVNIHRASSIQNLLNIGLYSAGCQVFQRPKEFDEFMSLVKTQIKAGRGSLFTYTLLEEKDFE